MTKPQAADYAREINIKAPRERVYEAVATLRGLRGWWTTLVRRSDKPGGTIRLEFTGLDEHIDMRVAVADRPSQVDWTILEHTSLDEWNGTTARFRLSAKGTNECVLRFRHVGLTARLACFDDCKAGWNHFMASLVAYIEQGEGEPFGAVPGAKRKKRAAPAGEDDAEDSTAFQAVIAAFEGDGHVEPPQPRRRAFGSNGLKVDGSIFAMLVKGALVLKLPRERVETLIESGRGKPFDAGRGRAMKEWVTIHASKDAWVELAREAHGFVAKKAR